VIRVLVVEDDPVAADAHRMYVERVPGFAVAGVVATGTAALRLMERQAVDLVLLDLHLPDGHGLRVVGRMRAAGLTADVIAVTSARDLEVVRQAVSMGVVQYLLKPFTFPSLRDRLERWSRYRSELSGGQASGQDEVDRALAALRSPEGAALPKGLSAPTLASVTAALRRAAADGMVLVRNDGLLPLAPGSRLAVIGEHARWARNQGGGSAQVFPEHVVSPLDGIRAAFGEQHVSYVPGVRASDALLPLGPEVAVDPSTGAPGVHVRLLAADGTVRLEEHRGTGRLTWLGDDVLQGVSTVEVRADFVAPAAGTYQIGFAGLGDFRLEVDGRAVSDGLFVPEGADPFVAFLAPPSQSFDIEMSEGQVVSLQLTHGVHLQEGFSAVMFTLGYREPFGTAEEELDRAVRAAAEADVAVVVVGTTERLESEGFDRPSLRLPDGQDEMVLRVLAANPRTVVLVNSGGPVVMPWLDEVPAVLLTWFPGQEMGSAIADVLSGAREPGGRMPTTWPTDEADVPVWQVEPVNGRLHYSEGVHVGYREWARRATRGGPAPAIPFGHGLGYTTWELSGASVAAADPRGAGVDLEVDVTNTGGRAGKQVVQVYVSRVSPSQVDRPALWLAGFALVHADAGQTVAARIHLEPRAFAHWSVDDHGWRTEPGTFAVRVGTSATDLVADLTVEVPRA
jgi:beta-glucosidase